jgi:hypothetical protein
METQQKTLIEFINYIRLSESEFESKINQKSSNLLVRISFPNEETAPFYIELLDNYPIEDDSLFQYKVRIDSSSIVDFHTACLYDKKLVTIYRKITC